MQRHIMTCLLRTPATEAQLHRDFVMLPLNNMCVFGRKIRMYTVYISSLYIQNVYI